MKFFIHRTSEFNSQDACPYEGATQEDFVYPNTQKPGRFWTIRLNTVKDLLNLCDQTETEVIISRAKGYSHGLPIIEIYDAYRE